jgi:hypothetical protein
VFAIVEIILAGVVIVIMQCVARDPDFRSAIGWLKWGHRVGFVIVACALISNAGVTLESGSDPRPIDVATIAALLAVLAISISRHGLAIRQARQAAERPAARLALFRVLILAAALAALPAIADGPGRACSIRRRRIRIRRAPIGSCAADCATPPANGAAARVIAS